MHYQGIQKAESLNSMLYQLSTELKGNDLEGMKTLCKGYVAGGFLDECKKPMDLLDKMSEEILISGVDTTFLCTCLKTIRRVDLGEAVEKWTSNQAQVTVNKELKTPDYSVLKPSDKNLTLSKVSTKGTPISRSAPQSKRKLLTEDKNSLPFKKQKVLQNGESKENKPICKKPNQRSEKNLKFCPKHPRDPNNYYCKTCSIPICAICVYAEKEHSNHEYLELSEATESCRHSIEKVLEKVMDKLKFYDETEANLQQVKAKLTASKKQTIKDIKNHADSLTMTIKNNGEENKIKANNAYEEKAEKLNSDLNRIKVVKSQANKTVQTIKKQLSKYTDAELVEDHGENQKTLENILNKEVQVDPRANYYLVYESVLTLDNVKQGNILANKALACKSVVQIKQLGHKRVRCQLVTYDIDGNEVKQGGAEVTAQASGKPEGEEKISCDITDNDNGTYDITVTATKPGMKFLSVSLFGQPVKNTPIKINPLLLKTVKVVESKGSKQGMLNFPSGVALSAAGEIYVADHSSKITVFDINGNCQKHFNVDCSSRKVQPGGIAFTKNDHLIITDEDGRQVYVYDTDWKLLRRFGGGCLRAPAGVAVNSEGLIYVADYGEGCVKQFTAEGKPAGVIGTRSEGPGQLAEPRGVTVNSRGQIIVSDHRLHRVLVFAPSGDFLHAFGKRGLAEGEFQEPSGVAVDQHDNVIVCDHCNHRLQMFTPEGDYLGRVDDPEDGVKGPYAITTVPGQPLKLVVTEANSIVKRFKFRILLTD